MKAHDSLYQTAQKLVNAEKHAPNRTHVNYTEIVFV